MQQMKINKLNFEVFAKAQGYKVDSEFKFLSDRKFKADWRVSKDNKNVLVEYEGSYGKSRHTTFTGYAKDCEKYNLAQLAGYVVLRYTVLNFDNVFNDLQTFFK
jgi:hypothetical protein